MNKPNKIITHHSGGTDAQPLADSSNCTAQDIDIWHSLRWPGFTSNIFKNEKGQFYHVGYHYVIQKDGKTVQTRAHNEDGAHTIGQNTSSIGVCFSGNFDATLPTKAQEKAWVALYQRLQKELGIPPQAVYPHRKYATKSCHGRKLTDDYFAILAGMPLERSTPTKEQLQSLYAQVLKLQSMITGKRFGK